MMKVLWITDKGYPAAGGAQITNLAFLRKLSVGFEYDCRIFSLYPLKTRAQYGPVKLYTYRDTDELKLMIITWKPDIIIGTMNGIHHSVRIARHFNIPTIAYFHSYEYCPPDADEARKWLISPSKEPASEKEIQLVMDEADALVVNSNYMRQRFEKAHKRDYLVIYPEFVHDEFLVRSDFRSGAQHISGVCGYAYKGANIFLDLANQFGQEKFLLAGHVDCRYLEDFRGQANITLIPFTPIKRVLKQSKIVLVPSQWPEPFGRIAIEAMANGIPTLASRCGGLTEILGSSSPGVTQFRNINAWRDNLGKLLGNNEACRLNAREGASLCRRYLQDRSTEELDRLIKRLTAEKKPHFHQRKTIAICGSTAEKSAYAYTNSTWSKLFEKESDYSVFSTENICDTIQSPVDYFIHHDYQQPFDTVSPPEEGKFIGVRTWDFGPFPPRWVKKINEELDQLWVYSQWIKRQAVQSGIVPSRIMVVPLGIDQTIFNPWGGSYPLPTRKKFKFLFVGAAILRKGVDILLKAYGQAFRPEDDVCLVFKDHSKDVFYKGEKFKDRILSLADDRDYPELIYLDQYLSLRELASLYRACDVGVFPYRAEGFCIPILEAMACGVPSIVPNFGACLDFCTPKTSFLLPVKRICAPVIGDFAINTLGFRELVDGVDFCEMAADTLALSLEELARMSPSELKKKARKGVWTALGHFKMTDIAVRIKKHLDRLESCKTPVRFRQSRLKTLKDRRKFELAKAMFANR
jgi:glycosyltransferase involved in cell wall biosynthesis